MKRLVLTSIAVLVLFSVFSGCSKVSECDYPFADVRWTRTGDGDTEYIRFSSNGEFSYYCACGNPVNDSDLCTGYSYDPETETISLKYLEQTPDTVTKIKIVRCTKTELILDFDGDIRSFVIDEDDEFIDKVIYNGREFLLVDFHDAVFTYDITYETDSDDIQHISHNKWSIVYYNGNLFAPEEDMIEIISYYTDNTNCTWTVTVDKADSNDTTQMQISLSDEEIMFFDQIGDNKLNESVLFDNIEIFGTLTKTYQDVMITATTDLFHYNGKWYWRSGLIDESTEGWPEYVLPLPESLNAKIDLKV